jgi:hypothetical protein
MIVRASGLQMGLGRISRPRRGVGVITMPDAGLNTMRRVEVCLSAGLLRMCVPDIAVGVLTDRHWVADRVEVPH